MTVIQDPPSISFLVVNQANGISPAAVLVDSVGALFGVPLNPISVTGTITATNPSVGANGVAVPGFSTQIGGPDPGGLLTAPRITTVAPAGADPGMVVRVAGTAAVSAPGGAALALDSTLTSGAMLAQVAGTGTAGVPAAGVVSVQGVVGGTFLPITDNTTGTLNNGAETAVSAVAIQVLAANASRKSALVQNTGAANIRVGTVGVTATTGFRLIPGAILTMAPPFDPVNAIYAIREGGVDSVAFALEVT